MHRSFVLIISLITGIAICFLEVALALRAQCCCQEYNVTWEYRMLGEDSQITYLSYLHQYMWSWKIPFAALESQITFIHSIHSAWASTKTLIKQGPVFGEGQGCRTWYLCVCLLSQYCILFRLPSGGTVSKKTRKEMGWKQRKRKGTQCDGACPSLIQVQPETCGPGATAATHGCGYSRSSFYLFDLKWRHKQPNKIMNGGGMAVTFFSCCGPSETDYCVKVIDWETQWIHDCVLVF